MRLRLGRRRGPEQDAEVPAEFTPLALPVDAGEMSPLMRAAARGTNDVAVALWRARVEQQFHDHYAGVEMQKFPEDLAIYERLLWERPPDVIVELGVFSAGSTLWFRDRLAAMRRYRELPEPRVLAVDVDLTRARRTVDRLGPGVWEGIEFIEGDLEDSGLLSRLNDSIPDKAEVLVVEDASHEAPTTRAALRGLAPRIRPGGYFIVEDTIVDYEGLRGADDWPRGCGEAITEWLRSDSLGAQFTPRTDLECYGITCHPGGILQRCEPGER